MPILGCKATSSGDSDRLLLFPQPPDKPRIQFLTWASGARQVGSTAWTLDEFLLGDEAVDRRRLNKPYGVAVHDGSVFVCDSKGLCVARMDFKNKKFSLFGFRGPGRLRKPLNIVVDSAGFKFVVDVVRKEIVVFGPDDRYVTAFAVPEPCHPVDVALHQNELFVLDNDSTPQVVVLDRQTGDVLRSFGSGGRGAGELHLPGSLCVGPDGYLYISDTMNWRIQKMTLAGEPVWQTGTPGYRLGQFGRPRGLRVGPDGTVYVVDGASELVQMFDEEGRLLMHFGGPGSTPGAMILPSSLAVDTSSIPYFQEYAHKSFDIDYLLFVVNQYGPHLINVYAFGSFPEGFRLSESEIGKLPDQITDDGIGPVEGKEIPLESEAKPNHPPIDDSD
jgi:sugar lactone lactonase YvrE